MASLASATTLFDDWVDVDDTSAKELTVRSKADTKPTDETHSKQSSKITCRDLDFCDRLNAVAADRLKRHASPIFVTELNPRKLYDYFLSALPKEMRQQYNCNACRAFMRRYGGLVVIDDDNGELHPLLWDPADPGLDPVFHSAVSALACLFRGQKVTREIKVTENTRMRMGATREKGGFYHMYLTMPESRVCNEAPIGFAVTSTADLAKMLAAVIKNYKLATVRQATQILENDKLPQADNHKAAARWLLDLLEKDKLRMLEPNKVNSTARQILGYRYAASAFTRCISQLKNGVLSTLLDGLEADHPWEQIEREWKKMTDPIQYLRPQVAPKAGNVSASERLFKSLGITENDLRRRFLVLNDVPTNCIMWQGQKSTAHSDSTDKLNGLKLFAHIITKGKHQSQDLPATRITFSKFITTVVPAATRIEYKLATRNSIYFLITGSPETKPLMHWHSKSNDNRASWYVYHEPGPVKGHGLKPDNWNEVKAIVPFPHLWDGAPTTTTFPLPDENANNMQDDGEDDNDGGFKWYHKKEGIKYLLALENVIDKDSRCLCLFPTMLKGEMHGVRATIEAYSNAGKKEYLDEGEVVRKGGYVAGIEMARDMGKRAHGDESETRHLLRVTVMNGERGIWEVVLFE
jgi:hypothetical protein